MFVEHARMTSTAYFDAFVRHLTSIAISTRRARFPIRFQISSRLTPGYERCRSTLRLPDATESSAHLQQREQTKVSVTFVRSEEHTSELQSRVDLVCRLLLEKKKRD